MGYYGGPAPTDWPALVGARMLVRDYHSSNRYVTEVELLEVSPSEDYLKFRYPTGSASWQRTEDTRLVEVLKQATTGATINLSPVVLG